MKLDHNRIAALLEYAAYASIVAVGLLFSYTFAKAGDPESHWLWCSVLHLCH